MYKASQMIKMTGGENGVIYGKPRHTPMHNWNDYVVVPTANVEQDEWIKCSERLPDTDREVFGWAKGCGIYCMARYGTETYAGWNTPWVITHWMERPRDPQ